MTHKNSNKFSFNEANKLNQELCCQIQWGQPATVSSDKIEDLQINQTDQIDTVHKCVLHTEAHQFYVCVGKKVL